MEPISELRAHGTFVSLKYDGAFYESKTAFALAIDEAHKKGKLVVAPQDAGADSLTLTFDLDDGSASVKLKRQKAIVRVSAQRKLVWLDSLVSAEPDWKTLKEFAIAYRYQGIVDDSSFDEYVKWGVGWTIFNEDKYNLLKTKPESATEADMILFSRRVRMQNVHRDLRDSASSINSGYCYCNTFAEMFRYVKDDIVNDSWRYYFGLYELAPLLLSYRSWQGYERRAYQQWWITREDTTTFDMVHLVLLNDKKPIIADGDITVFEADRPVVMLDQKTNHWSIKFDRVLYAQITETYKK